MQADYIDYRIGVLKAAEALAITDRSPENTKENADMIRYCNIACIELYKLKRELGRSKRDA